MLHAIVKGILHATLHATLHAILHAILRLDVGRLRVAGRRRRGSPFN